MAAAASERLTVMRTWAHAVSRKYALQPKQGVYNEVVFRGLDYVIETARQTGVKVDTHLVHPADSICFSEIEIDDHCHLCHQT